MADIAQLNLRIADVLRDPRETLDVELKGWLDLDSNEHRAVLAKSLIALANHGGGLVIIGLRQDGAEVVEAAGRPAELGAYNTDAVNGVVARYAEPAFHCEARIVASARDERPFPVIMVPGGHRVPIRSCRDGPNGQHIRRNTYYIRRPGPQSDSPQNGREWDDLLRRCTTNAREELLDSFRTILAGGGTSPLALRAEADALRGWFDESHAQWLNLVGGLPEGSAARMPLGHYSIAYIIDGDFERPDLARLGRILQEYPRITGWPPFWYPTRPEIAPYIHEGNIECWLGREVADRDAAHADFWRASPAGAFFLVRGYQEDSSERVAPAAGFDITLPTWRIGEVLLHAEAMAQQLGVPEAEINFLVQWTGLAGRELVSLGNPLRWIMDGHRARQDTHSASLKIPANRIDENLPEFVSQLVTPLYHLFDFFELPGELVVQELARMRDRRV